MTKGRSIPQHPRLHRHPSEGWDPAALPHKRAAEFSLHLRARADFSKRRPDGKAAWIPAFAGMTKEEGGAGRGRQSSDPTDWSGGDGFEEHGCTHDGAET